ncbi:hypothetical protein VaNZ11_014275 [Volvox africanus]|uniref:TRAF-type domain-containing protein n=1 Tax=Volvox africanus TaxID=51714 RepID=A0ABQ5SJF1_9CHLO|nr:hypothetical protein VaNZ11_014275 [Volvox africanus]
MSEQDITTAIKKVQDELMCPICLDMTQLPVNFTCFRGCGGHFSNSSTCLRSTLCMHCANEALQLGLAPVARFRGTGGFAHCLICRDTRVDARMLTPDNAYAINHNVLGIMDALGMGAMCRQCDKDMGSQAALYQHYLRRCPDAVVKCRFRGCSHWHIRRGAGAHEDTCPVGRSQCGQCGTWIDRSELLRHMVTTCRLRVVNCVLCKHSALLPDMLEHLRLHQRQLQGRARARAVAGKAAAASGDAVVAESPASAGSEPTQAADMVGPKPLEPDRGGATTSGIASAPSASTPILAPAAMAAPQQAGQSRTFGAAAAEHQPEPERPLQPQSSSLLQQPQQSAWAPRGPLAQQELSYLSRQAAPQLLEILRRQQHLLQRLQTQRQTLTSGLVVQQQEQEQQQQQEQAQRQPGVSPWQADRTNQPDTLAAAADIGQVTQAASGGDGCGGANLAVTPVVPTPPLCPEVAGVATVRPGAAAATAPDAVVVERVEGSGADIIAPQMMIVDPLLAAPEQHGLRYDGADALATVTATNRASRGISSFAIATEGDGTPVGDDIARSTGGSLDSGDGSSQRSLDMAAMQQDRASQPATDRNPWLGIYSTSSGGADSSSSNLFADTALHRTPSWRTGLGGPAALISRRGGVGPRYLSDVFRSGNDGGGDQDEYAFASELSSEFVSAAAADEAVRMVRTAVAIVRASAAASERRSQRQQLALASSAASGSGGAANSGGGLGVQASAGGGGGTMAAAWWGVACPGAFGRSHAAAAAALAEMEQADRSTSSSWTPAVAAIEISPQDYPSAAAGPLQKKPLANGIRRSFSDTELVFDVLEELVRASTSSGEHRAVRISASGI